MVVISRTDKESILIFISITPHDFKSACSLFFIHRILAANVCLTEFPYPGVGPMKPMAGHRPAVTIDAVSIKLIRSIRYLPLLR